MLPSSAHLAHLLGIPERTARRWKAAGTLPRPWHMLLLLLDGRDLGQLEPAWRGWRLMRGELVSPEGLTFRPGEVLAIFVRQQELAHLRRLLTQPAQYALALPEPISGGE